MSINTLNKPNRPGAVAARGTPGGNGTPAFPEFDETQMVSASSPLLTRRQMLQRMCAGFGMVGLAGLLGPQWVLAAANPRLPHFAPRARRVIFLFLNGGPSHVDTLDPKPALQEYEGQQPTGELYKKSKGTGFMPSPFQFNKCGQSGIEVC